MQKTPLAIKIFVWGLATAVPMQEAEKEICEKCATSLRRFLAEPDPVFAAPKGTP